MVRGLIFLAFLAGPALPDGEAQRPRCTAAIQSSFWPLEANSNPRLAQQLAREGVLQMCTVTRFRRRWQLVVINAKRVAESRKRPVPPARSGE